jgi:hypothetical protein
VLRIAGHHSRAEIAGGTDLERDAQIHQPLDKFRIIPGTYAVPYAFGSQQVQRVSYGLRAGRLAGVGHSA